MWRVSCFFCILNYGWKIPSPNIVIPIRNFEKISIKNCNTKCSPDDTYGQDQIWPFSVSCFENYSGVLAFVLFSGMDTYSLTKKKQILLPPGWLISELVAKFIYFRKVNWIKLKVFRLNFYYEKKSFRQYVHFHIW